MFDEIDTTRIGVSAGLLGEPAAGDATRSHRPIIDELGRFAELVPVRAGASAAEVDDLQLSGLVLGHPSADGDLAAVVRVALPWLPVEQARALRDRSEREDFLDAVFALARWHAMNADGFTVESLAEFHRRSKFQLLAHNPAIFRDLDQLVARASSYELSGLREIYLRKFMAAMRSRASRRRHVSVLQHLAGFVKRRVSQANSRELTQTIREYQRGQLPRTVPLVLLRHHAREQGVDYLSGQTYFTPFPLRLLLA